MTHDDFERLIASGHEIDAGGMQLPADWLLRHLVTPSSGALRLRRAVIVGPLDLCWHGSHNAPLPVLCLTECAFQPDEDDNAPDIDLSHAHVDGLVLVDCRLTHLRAVGAHVHGSVDLTRLQGNDGVQACWCKLSRAFIAGDVLAGGVRLHAPDHSTATDYDDVYDWDWALNLADARIEGSVIADAQTFVEGGVLLDLAHLDGDLRFSGTLIGRDNQPCLSMERTCVQGSVRLDGGGSRTRISCQGQIWMHATAIGGSLDVAQADLSGETPNHRSVGFSLYGFAVTIGGSCTLGRLVRHGDVQWDAPDRVFSIASRGRLMLFRAQVGGNLSVIDVSIDDIGPLHAGWQWLEPKGEPPRSLHLRGSRINEKLSILENRMHAGVDLIDVRCASLNDDPNTGYGQDCPVFLDGLQYERVGDPALSDRLRRWLPSDPDQSDLEHGRRDTYRPQPYAQLAKVLSAHGEDHDAWKVASTKALFDAKKRWKHGASFWGRWVYAVARLYGWGFNFGLSPSRATGTLVLSIVMGAALFGGMSLDHAMVMSQTPVANWVSDRPPRFFAQRSETPGSAVACDLIVDGEALASVGNLLVYAADVFVPLVDFREEGRCEVGADGVGPEPKEWKLTVYRILKMVYTTIGWVVTSLALITFSGVTRNWLTRS